MKSKNTRSASAQKVAVPDSIRKLTEVQETVSELVADLIMNGGHTEDTHALLHAVLRHQHRRMFGDRDDHNKFAEAWRSDWHRKLAAHWPEPEAKQPEQPRPTAVKDIIQANVRQHLRDAMKEFMDDTEGLADAYLMLDILINWRSGERELGEAFSYALEGSHTYVRIPWAEEKRFRKLASVFDEADE